MKQVIPIIAILVVLSFAQENGARYLIITHDAFYDAVRPLAEWKYRKGLKSKVVKLSDIGSDSIAIKNYIVNAYNNWQIQPEYLLLVGAPNYLPFPRISSTHTDNYYTNMDDSIYNDLLSGRLTVHDTTEAQTVVNKILIYEKTPYMVDSLWFRNACLIVRENYDLDDSIYWSDVNYASSLMVNSGFVDIDTLSRVHGHNANSVIASVNSGRAIVMYRGTATNSWHSPFDVNPDLTQNGSRLPIVISTTCNTLGAGPNPAYSEKWFLTGTPTNPRGGAGYFATSTSGQAYLRSAIAKAFHNALFNEGKRTFGECCEAGRINVYEMYPYQGGKREYLGFTTVGDPEMNLWTDTPCSLNVQHPDSIPYGHANFAINVREAASSAPIIGALVCIVGKVDTSIYSLDTTDINGDAYFDIGTQVFNDTIFVTVTGKNLQPYCGFMITAYAHGSYIIYLKSSIDDSLGGNSDGIINPGEDVNMPLWVLNCGDSSAVNIAGVLQTNDFYTTITDSSKAFGDIPTTDSAFTGQDGYKFSVRADCPDLHVIDFDLVCRDINDSVWISHFSKQVLSAYLVFENAQVSGGNGNNTVEPGESVTVAVTIRNQGSTAIENVVATLQCFSSYAGIIDSIGSYTHIGPDSTQTNNLNPFRIYSDPATPQGTYVDFQMILSAGYYIDTIPFTLIVGKIDYFVWNPDLTPASGENIDSILTSLGYDGDYDTTLTSNLHEYATVFVCCGVWPNNYLIMLNSNDAIALTDFANSGGKLCLEGGDVWYYDPVHNYGHNFGPLFGLRALGDGSDNMGPIEGQTATFTENMYFAYAGENRFMDNLRAESTGAFLIFQDDDNDYDCGIAYETTMYSTVGLSFELGLLVDDTPPSTRAALLDSIMHFFGRTLGIAENDIKSNIISYAFDIYPNPINNILRIKLTSPAERKVNIKLYDVSGRLVNTVFDSETRVGLNEFSIMLKDLPTGIYFVQLLINSAGETIGKIFTKKIVKIK